MLEGTDGRTDTIHIWDSCFFQKEEKSEFLFYASIKAETGWTEVGDGYMLRIL